MKYKKFRFLVLSDLYRITGSISTKAFIKQLLFGISYKYVFWFRACHFTKKNRANIKGLFYPFCWLMLRHYSFKLGISIPPDTQIGSGFYIGHFGGIVVNDKSVIGSNCNISHNVTLGQTNRGKKAGYPIIGDNVYIAPGAKIIGSVRVGNNVSIGPNAVVVDNIPDNSVVVNNKGQVISDSGSSGYINRIDYNKILKVYSEK